MAKWIIMMSALVACVAAEPPSGYSYSRPSSLLIGGGGYSLGGGGGGYSLGGGGGHSGGGFSLGGLGLGGSGGYRAVSSGYQTSEGQYVDPHLLEEIKNIILKDEIQNQQYRGSNSIGIGHGISSSYGVPSPVYGIPISSGYNEKIVGIELGNIKQGIQVAQYEQDGGYSDGGYSSGGGYSLGGGGYSLGGGGYSLGGGSGYSLGGSGHGLSLSSGYSSGPSSIGYNTIAIPSGTYGVPLPSSRYGSPRH